MVPDSALVRQSLSRVPPTLRGDWSAVGLAKPPAKDQPAAWDRANESLLLPCLGKGRRNEPRWDRHHPETNGENEESEDSPSNRDRVNIPVANGCQRCQCPLHAVEDRGEFIGLHRVLKVVDSDRSQVEGDQGR